MMYFGDSVSQRDETTFFDSPSYLGGRYAKREEHLGPRTELQYPVESETDTS
jgi:hypothetical protein